MGNLSSTTQMQHLLQQILKKHGAPVKAKTILLFLQMVTEVAPWFLEEGLLNLPQWEHLGRDQVKEPSERALFLPAQLASGH